MQSLILPYSRNFTVEFLIFFKPILGLQDNVFSFKWVSSFILTSVSFFLVGDSPRCPVEEDQELAWSLISSIKSQL